MDTRATAETNQYIDQAMACLINGAHNRAKQCSASPAPDEREWILQDLDLLKLSYQTLGQRIHRHIADTARRLNIRVPIHHLPNELVTRIFALTLIPNLENSRHYMNCLTGLGLVSKDWNGIIRETPSFWAQISSAYSDTENRAAVLRSKECRLWVCYDDDDFHGRDEEKGVFLDLASREAYRWQSAEFGLDSNHTVSLLRRFVSLSAPSLETLKIDCIEPEEEELGIEGSIDIFSGGADRLRHVDLCNFPIPWNSRLLSRLETLKISISDWPGGYSTPSTKEITDILRRCPELHAFEIAYHGEEDIHVIGGTTSETEAVCLPHLSSFTLDLDNAEAFSRIISSVRIPACKEFDLQCDDPMHNILSNEAGHLTAALLSVIQSVPEITVTLERSTLVLYSSLVIDIHLCHNSPWEDLAWLIEHTTKSISWPPIHAIVTCDDSLPFLHVVDLLHKMPSITSLTLEGNSDQYITLLSYPTLNNGIYEWVLPNLRTLSLRYCPGNTLQLLIDLAGNRQQGANMNRGDDVQLGLPIKLEKVHAEKSWAGVAWTGPFYTALQELKGDDWDHNIIDQ
ncbi:hypothetical protein FRB95_009461 [Tulasnella sp. JGI-2019a]|nr:hypothetical protein FRB95_009461 [Tulasnella sp. JGI-2019a]